MNVLQMALVATGGSIVYTESLFECQDLFLLDAALGAVWIVNKKIKILMHCIGPLSLIAGVVQ